MKKMYSRNARNRILDGLLPKEIPRQYFLLPNIFKLSFPTYLTVLSNLTLTRARNDLAKF